MVVASLGAIFWPILLFFAVLDLAQLAPVAPLVSEATTIMDNSTNSKPIEETTTINSTTTGLPILTGATESQSPFISREETTSSENSPTTAASSSDPITTGPTITSTISASSSETPITPTGPTITSTISASSSETPITPTGSTITSTISASSSPETPSIVASASVETPHAATFFKMQTSEVLPTTLRSPAALENTTLPTKSTTSQQFTSSTASSTNSSLLLPSYTANHDITSTPLSEDRKGKSLTDEDKILAPTTVSFAISSHNSTTVLVPSNEEGLERKPFANLVSKQPREQDTNTTREAEGGVSVQIRETSSESSFVNSTVPGSTTGIPSAEPGNSTIAKFTEETPSECSIHLTSTLIQRSELFVPEALLSESDDLPASIAMPGRVASWAVQKCTAIQAMLKTLNETCKKELVDRVPKFRFIALSNVWNYLCDHNATNLTALASQPLTCVEALPTFVKTCATTNKLGFSMHWPSDLVLTPRPLKETDCRTLINTNSCLTEQIHQQAKSKCEASQRQHLTAMMDVLLKSMNCDQVQKNSKSAATTVQMYSMWTIFLGMVVGGFFFPN